MGQVVCRQAWHTQACHAIREGRWQRGVVRCWGCGVGRGREVGEERERGDWRWLGQMWHGEGQGNVACRPQTQKVQKCRQAVLSSVLHPPRRCSACRNTHHPPDPARPPVPHSLTESRQHAMHGKEPSLSLSLEGQRDAKTMDERIDRLH